MPPQIYLDHNSTTPPLDEVIEAMAAAQREFYANPESQHDLGRKSRRALEAARKELIELLGGKSTGMDADQLIFTSGVTEANTLALRGIGSGKLQRLAVSGLEHVNVTETAVQMQNEGQEVTFLNALPSGLVDLDHLRQVLEETQPQLVSIIGASNETGVIQPIPEIASLAHDHGALVHIDAAQLVGKSTVNFFDLGADTLSFSAHKFNGPNGIGGLLAKHGVQITPQMHGGHQQSGIRPGTETVALAVGMATALRAWQENRQEWTNRLSRLRDRFETKLGEIHPELEIIGKDSPRLCQTTSAAFVGLDRQALVMAFDLAGVACSSGSACASGSSEPSPVLQAMGLPEEIVNSTVRFSLGMTTSESDIDDALGQIREVCRGFPVTK